MNSLLDTIYKAVDKVKQCAKFQKSPAFSKAIMIANLKALEIRVRETINYLEGNNGIK